MNIIEQLKPWFDTNEMVIFACLLIAIIILVIIAGFSVVIHTLLRIIFPSYRMSHNISVAECMIQRRVSKVINNKVEDPYITELYNTTLEQLNNDVSWYSTIFPCMNTINYNTILEKKNN